MKKLFPVFAAALALVACKPKAEPQPEYIMPVPEQVVMYQVNPRVFADSASLLAVIPQLDSIRSLGANVFCASRVASQLSIRFMLNSCS